MSTSREKEDQHTAHYNSRLSELKAQFPSHDLKETQDQQQADTLKTRIHKTLMCIPALNLPLLKDVSMSTNFPRNNSYCCKKRPKASNIVVISHE